MNYETLCGHVIADICRDFFFHENSSTFKDLKIVVTTQLKLCNTLLLNDSNYV